VSRLRRPFLFDRFFFVMVRLLKPRREFDDADFQHLALAIRRARSSSVLLDRLGISSRPLACDLRPATPADHFRTDEIYHVAQTSAFEVCGLSTI